MKTFLQTILAVAACCVVPAARAGLILTIENPGIQQTTVSGATTETFDSLPSGPLGTYVSPIGTFSGGAIVNADVFGGANGSPYLGIGSLSGTTSSILQFDEAGKTYIGLWWSAGDPFNELSFYDTADQLLATYRTANLIPLLSSSYFGNPNSGGNVLEPYAYLNFTTTGDSRIGRVIFSQDNTFSGFELDNVSVHDVVITPPGHSLPETGSTFILLGASMVAISLLRRKFAK